MKVLLLAGSIMAATPLAAQSSPTPQDSAAIRAVVEDSVHRAFVRRIVADTAWLQVADLRTMTDVPSAGKGFDSGRTDQRGPRGASARALGGDGREDV